MQAHTLLFVCFSFLFFQGIVSQQQYIKYTYYPENTCSFSRPLEFTYTTIDVCGPFNNSISQRLSVSSLSLSSSYFTTSDCSGTPATTSSQELNNACHESDDGRYYIIEVVNNVDFTSNRNSYATAIYLSSCSSSFYSLDVISGDGCPRSKEEGGGSYYTTCDDDLGIYNAYFETTTCISSIINLVPWGRQNNCTDYESLIIGSKTQYLCLSAEEPEPTPEPSDDDSSTSSSSSNNDSTTTTGDDTSSSATPSSSSTSSSPSDNPTNPPSPVSSSSFLSLSLIAVGAVAAFML